MLLKILLPAIYLLVHVRLVRIYYLIWHISYQIDRYANRCIFIYLGLSFSAEKSVNLFDYVAKSSDDEPLVFVVSK